MDAGDGAAKRGQALRRRKPGEECVASSERKEKLGFVWGWGVRGGPLGSRCGLKGHWKLAGTPSLPVSCHHHRPRPT